MFDRTVDDVLAKYWRDYGDHRDDFAPAFLANDVLRLWRTLCVNYEARTETEPAEKKAKRSLKNYKLKHSRLMRCYSGVLYLLADFTKHRTVAREKAREMVGLSPIERIGRTGELDSAWKEPADGILHAYDAFLEATNRAENELVAIFLDREQRVEFLKDSEKLAERVFTALNAIGAESRFHRLLVV